MSKARKGLVLIVKTQFFRRLGLAALAWCTLLTYPLQADTISLIISTDDSPPAEIQGGAAYQLLTFNESNTPRISNDGQILFRPKLTFPDGSTKTGIFRLNTNGEVVSVVDETRPLPGFSSNAQIADFTSYEMHANGHAMVRAAVNDGSHFYPTSALWCSNQSNGARIAPIDYSGVNPSTHFAVSMGSKILDGATCGREQLVLVGNLTANTGQTLRFMTVNASGVSELYSDSTFPGLLATDWFEVPYEEEPDGSRVISYGDRYLFHGRFWSHQPYFLDGLWFRDQAGLRLIAKELAPAPGVSSHFLGGIGSFGLTSQNSIAFVSAAINNANVGDIKDGIWTNFSGSLEPALMAGAPAPEFGPTYVLDRYNGDFKLFDNGTVLAQFSVRDTNTQNPGPIHTALWRVSASGRELLLRSGVPLVGDTSGYRIASYQFKKLATSSQGKIAMEVRLYNEATENIYTSSRTALVSNASGAFRLLALTDEVVPGTNGKSIIELGSRREWNYQVNDLGQVLFPATLRIPPTTSVPNPLPAADQPLLVDRNGNLRMLVLPNTRVSYQGSFYNLIATSVSFVEALGPTGDVAVAALALASPIIQFIGKVHIVDQPGFCRVDYDGDQIAGVADLFLFLNPWFAGSADFNTDGRTNVADVRDFISAWQIGC